MTVDEKKAYVYNKLGMAYSKQFEERKDDLIKYLQANDKEVVINYNNVKNDYGFLLQVLKGTIDLSGTELFKVDNGFTTYNINKKTLELINNNLSRNVEKLTTPIELFDICDIRQFKNLKELTLTNYGIKIDKKMLDMIVNETNIETLNCSFNIDDDIKEDGIVVDMNGKTVFYKDLIIKPRNASKSVYINTSSKSPHESVDKILDLVVQNNGYTDPNEFDSNEKRFSIYMCSNEAKNDIDYTIQFRKDRAGSWNSEVDGYVKEDVSTLSFNYVTNIKDVVNTVKKFENHGYKIDKVRVELENKNYEDINLLKSLENKYDLKIGYGASKLITVNDFIMMRETLNYYKELIESANLSPIEQIMYAYDLIKSFEYQEVKEEEDKDISRKIHSIIRDGKIVCLGYSVFLSQLLEELGIESYAVGVTAHIFDKDGNLTYGDHERNIISVHDDKYGIDGYYAFDATWDCAHNIVKCIDENGEEKTRSLDFLKPNDKIIKYYDNLVLYQYFLVSGDRYQEVFNGEKMPNFKNAKHFETAAATSVDDATMKFPISKAFDKDKLIQIIRTVRKQEGYSEEEIEKSLKDVIELNKLENEEIIQKR